jgi:hypothetical protein
VIKTIFHFAKAIIFATHRNIIKTRVPQCPKTFVGSFNNHANAKNTIKASNIIINNFTIYSDTPINKLCQ